MFEDFHEWDVPVAGGVRLHGNCVPIGEALARRAGLGLDRAADAADRPADDADRLSRPGRLIQFGHRGE